MLRPLSQEQHSTTCGPPPVGKLGNFGTSDNKRGTFQVDAVCGDPWPQSNHQAIYQCLWCRLLHPLEC